MGNLALPLGDKRDMVKRWPVTCRHWLFRLILMHYSVPSDSLYKQVFSSFLVTRNPSNLQKVLRNPPFPCAPSTILDTAAFVLHQARHAPPLHTIVLTKVSVLCSATHASPLYTGTLRRYRNTLKIFKVAEYSSPIQSASRIWRHSLQYSEF